MKDRLLKIITSEGLSPALFADKLGIQRSGISHILSGRNYPSFDFLQKLLTHFPKLNAEWLILGQGAMYKTAVADISDLLTSSESVEKAPDDPPISEKTQILSSGDDCKKKTVEAEQYLLPSAKPEKTIEKMMLLYSDKTFVMYNHANF